MERILDNNNTFPDDLEYDQVSLKDNIVYVIYSGLMQGANCSEYIWIYPQ